MRRTLLLMVLSLLACMVWGQSYNYRYWINNDINGAVSGSATGETQFYVDLSERGNGIHAIHVQAKNSDGVWSSVRTRYILLNDEQQQAATTARYWIDNNTSNIHSGVATSGAIDLDLSGIGNGIHAVHYQTVAANGTPSAVRTRYFLLNDEQQQTAIKARYWLDNDMTTMHNEVVASGVIDLDLSKLDVGFHAVHFQTMAADGTPSAVRTRYFYIDRVEDCYTASVSIDGGEATDYPVSDDDIVIDIGELESGEHTLHIKIYNSQNSLMDEQTQTFTVEPAGPTPVMMVNMAVPVPSTSDISITLGGSNCIDQPTTPEPLTIRNDNLLERNEFIKDLQDYFQDSSLDASTLRFEFTLPSAKNGNATFNADSKGQWIVSGYSGAQYTLALANDNKEIHVVRMGGVSLVSQTLACINDNVNGVQSVIKYHQGMYQDDILNYCGHNHLGERETFTAYVGVSTSDTDLPGKFDDIWLNVRFLRPLDLQDPHGFCEENTNDEWQYIDLSKAIIVRDWRDYMGDPRNVTGGSGENYMFDFSYYQIELDADDANILTDAGLDADVRVPVTGSSGNVLDLNNYFNENYSTKNLWNISEIPGMVVEKVLDSGGTPCPSGTKSTFIRYKNNAGLTGDFRLFVPIRMNYVFGQSQQSSQIKYVTIEIKGQDQEPDDDIVIISSDVFSAKTAEGVRMVFKITDEENKECQVGDDSYSAAISTSTMGTVTIPSTVNGYTVRSIGYYAFYSCRLVEEVVIPEGITQIRSFAFKDCTGITGVTFPNSLVYLYDSAFDGCYGLTSVTIPKNVYAVQDMIFCCSSFPRCINLVEIKVDPQNPYLEAVDNVLYLKNRKGLMQYPAGKADTSYKILDGVTGLFSGVLSGLQHTKSIKVPEGVAYINGPVFSESINLEEIELPSSITTFDGYNMIYGCTKLTKVISHIMNPWSVDSRVFQVSEGVHTSAALYVPKGTKSLYEAADGWKNFYPIIEMEQEASPIIEFADANVKAICVENWDTDGDGELSEEEAAKVATIGNVFQETEITSFDELRYFTGLTSIEYMAFSNCVQLTSLIIPRGVKEVGGGLFFSCDALTSVSVDEDNSWLDSRGGCNAIIETATNTLLDGCKTTVIPDDITAIGDLAFYHIHGMTSLTIPNTVTSIGFGGLFGLQDLTSLTIPKSVISLGYEVIGNMNALETLVVETGNPVYDSREGCNAIIETATNNLFAACKTTIIPESVTSIGYYAYDAQPITSLHIPANVVVIDELAVRLCSSLAVITVDEANSVYDSRNGCNAIMETASDQLLIGCKNTVVPEGTRSIGVIAFMGCKELEEVTLPKTATFIGASAFEYCTKLTKVTVYMQEPPVITECTFTNRANATLYVPIGSKSLYQTAEYWKEFMNIIEMDEEEPLHGDVNGDGLVNGTDLVALTCMILGQQEENAAADVNGDGLVNGTDYVALVDIILNFTPSSDRSMAARSIANKSLMTRVGIETFSIAAGESQTITITLDNPNTDVTLVQFDLILPEGLRLKTDEDGYAVEMTGRTTWKDHTVYIGSQDGESVRMLVASGKNAVIDGNCGGILNLTLVADENYDGGDIMLTNILCTSPDVQECRPYDYTLHLASGSATGIDRIGEGQMSVIYNTSGLRLSAPRKGINIINGKKVVIK